MSDLERMLNEWRDQVHGTDSYERVNQFANQHTATLIHEIWVPRVCWFQPPKWKIFRWAYKITRKEFHGVYPASCSIGGGYAESSIHVDENGRVSQIGIQINRQEFPKDLEGQLDVLTKAFSEKKEDT